MSETAKLYLIHALSPLHAGVGQGIGAINLPTAREKSTGYPYFPGSSVKGVLREAAEQKLGAKEAEKEIFGAFGPSSDQAGDARGGIVFSDASLLALPVRSLFGTFAWVTCPYVLTRLFRDAREASVGWVLAREKANHLKSLTSPATDVRIGDKSVLTSEGTLFLEELSIGVVKEDVAVKSLASDLASALWPGDDQAKKFFESRLVVVTDTIFGFLSRTATEIRHRVKIDPATGTAAGSGPWTEEHLPAETLLHGVVIGRPTQYINRANGAQSKPVAVPATVAMATLEAVIKPSGSFRFGGKSTIGMGRAQITLVTS